MKRTMTGLALVLFAWTLTACNALVDVEEEGPTECDIYCNIMLASCDDVFEDTPEGRERCYDRCDRFPFRPQTDENGDVIEYGLPVANDDSFECRIYHGQTAHDIAVRDGEPNNSHCPEAAPIGGGTCSDASPFCAKKCYACDQPQTKEDLDTCEAACEEMRPDGNDTAAAECRRAAVDRAVVKRREGDDSSAEDFCEIVTSTTPCRDITDVLNNAPF